MKRALVISGGGSKGAFAGGVVEKLLEVNPAPYDMYVGTSTGSLLISHLALGKVATIKKAFTGVTQESILTTIHFVFIIEMALKKLK